MSAFVKRAPEIGVLRGESRRGCKGGVLSICRGRSGDALIRNHCEEVSELIAILDCVCGRIFPARAQRHSGRMCISFAATRPPPRCREYGCESTEVFEVVSLVRSNCTRVT